MISFHAGLLHLLHYPFKMFSIYLTFCFNCLCYLFWILKCILTPQSFKHRSSCLFSILIMFVSIQSLFRFTTLSLDVLVLKHIVNTIYSVCCGYSLLQYTSLLFVRKSPMQIRIILSTSFTLLPGIGVISLLTSGAKLLNLSHSFFRGLAIVRGITLGAAFIILPLAFN